MTTAREELKTRLNDLVMGHEAEPDEGAWVDWVPGVVDFWDDSVDLERLTDGVMALASEVAEAALSEPSDETPDAPRALTARRLEEFILAATHLDAWQLAATLQAFVLEDRLATLEAAEKEASRRGALGVMAFLNQYTNRRREEWTS